MADYIRFRLTAAKAGASMALLALIGGFAARGDAAPATVNAVPAKASTGSFLKLGGIKGNAKTSFLKIEQKVLKIDSALASLQHKLATSYYSAQKIDSTFLKIKSANSTFLKIDDAAKIYLNGSDAAARFLKIDGTAANASELGGQAPGAFFQGRGNVVTGAVTFAPTPGGGTTTPLLEDSHGIIAVLITGNADQTQFMINNNSGVPLEAVVQGQTTAAMTLNQGLNLLPAVQRANNGAGELHVQIMPGGAFNQVVTLILGVAPAFADGSLSATKISATGQMLIGLL